MSAQVSSNRAFFNQLKKYYTYYTGGFLVFLVVLAILEQLGLPRNWIGYVFLFATIARTRGSLKEAKAFAQLRGLVQLSPLLPGRLVCLGKRSG